MALKLTEERRMQAWIQFCAASLSRRDAAGEHTAYHEADEMLEELEKRWFSTWPEDYVKAHDRAEWSK